MYSKSLITIFATAVTLASALPSSADYLFRHRRNAIPTQYQARGYKQDADLLEPYDQYHERYLSFSCQDKHNTAFWDQCCHPVLKTQNAETDLPDTCWDAVDDGGDCDDDGGDGDAPATTTKAPSNPIAQPTATTEKIVTKTKTTSPPAQTTSSGGDSGGDWNGPGYGTYYYQNGNAGACGDYHGDNDLIVAIDIERYGDTGRVSSLCGKKVLIKNTANGNEVTATIADVCPTCVAPPGGSVKNSIDMSYGTFGKLASHSDGQITIEWKFV